MSEISTEIGTDYVAAVVIDRPPNNHVSVGLMRRLADELEKLDQDKRVRAILLASAGKNFCAGADLNEPRGLVSEEAPQGISQLYVEAVRLFSIKKPIVAAVQGAAVGAGLGLALVADHRVAGADARFSANFTKLGFHPGFGLTHTLPRLIGPARASLMFLTARRFKAEEALEMGLCEQVAAPQDLRTAARALAAEIAENAPLAIVATRTTLRADLAAAVKAQTDIEHREQTWLRATKDFAEGVRAVAERRVGNFTGE
jgi:enoyl-CoA hydratase/carnithine racemase